MDNAMLDISPDDAMELNKKRKMLRWDAKKRKFVKVTLTHDCVCGTLLACGAGIDSSISFL